MDWINSKSPAEAFTKLGRLGSIIYDVTQSPRLGKNDFEPPMSSFWGNVLAINQFDPSFHVFYLELFDSLCRVCGQFRCSYLDILTFAPSSSCHLVLETNIWLNLLHLIECEIDWVRLESVTEAFQDLVHLNFSFRAIWGTPRSQESRSAILERVPNLLGRTNVEVMVFVLGPTGSCKRLDVP